MGDPEERTASDSDGHHDRSDQPYLPSEAG
jgi:hypothetical protein